MKSRELSYCLLLKISSPSLRVERPLGKHHSSREQNSWCLRLQPWCTTPLPTHAWSLSGCSSPGYFRVPEGVCAAETPITSTRTLGQFPNTHPSWTEQSQGCNSVDNCLFGSCCLWLGAAVEGLLAPGLPCLSPHTGTDKELRFSFP